MNYIKSKAIIVMKKVAVWRHATIIYKNKYGIKAINPCSSSIREPDTSERFIDPALLYLDIDYLIDDYTLLDTAIPDSPHYGFMSALNGGKNIVETEYYTRYSNGYLDERTAILISKRKLESFLSTFECRKNEIANDEYNPVLVYERHGRLYIYDGKHRAAMCALLGKQVKCRFVENFLDYDGMVKRRVELMKANRDLFSKQLKFLN